MKYLGKITDNKDLVTKEYVEIDSTKTVYYAECTDATDTQIRTVSVPEITKLFKGLKIVVSFANPHTGNTTPQLKINNLTAKNMVIGYLQNLDYWLSGNTFLFTYYDGDFHVDGTRTSTYHMGNWVQLSNSTNSADTTLAATSYAVKSAYDLADTANTTAKSGIVYYGVCDTAADTKVKEVTISGITELFTGLHVRIYFTNAQGYDGQPQLKINSLSAKNIKIYGATSVDVNEWYANTVVDMVYTGSVFTLVRGNHASTSYYGLTKLSSAIDSTATDLAATPSAVKTAYDLADTANTTAGTALSQSIFYGTCSTAASTQTKEVTISGIAEYYTGLLVRILFTNEQSYIGSPKLKINNLSAVDMQRTSSNGMTTGEWSAGTVMDLVYDGTAFVAVRDGRATTTYLGITKLSDSVSSTSTSLAATANSVKTAYDLANAALPGSALVTSVDSSSTDTQVPSAKLLYDTAETKQSKIFIRTILVSTSGWTGTDPYSFSLATANIYYTPTIHTKADVDAPSESITKMISDGIKAMYIENTNGNLSLVSVGAIPSTPIELQLSIYDVAPIPIITAQASQSHYNVGDTILLSVTPTSDDYTYQWQYSINGGSSWSNGSSTSDTYSWSAGTSQNGRWYRCRVTNSYGSAVSNVVITFVG